MLPIAQTSSVMSETDHNSQLDSLTKLFVEKSAKSSVEALSQLLFYSVTTFLASKLDYSSRFFFHSGHFEPFLEGESF